VAWWLFGDLRLYLQSVANTVVVQPFQQFSSPVSGVTEDHGLIPVSFSSSVSEGGMSVRRFSAASASPLLPEVSAVAVMISLSGSIAI
jgi:hypothetical protein